MTETLIEQLEDMARIYLNELEHTLDRLNLAKDKILLRELKKDDRYQLFRHKIVSIKAIRNREHYYEFGYVSPAYSEDSSIRDELQIKFIDGSTCTYKYYISGDGDPMAEEINNIYVNLPLTPNNRQQNTELIENISSILIGLDMDPELHTQLISLMYDIMNEHMEG